MPPQRLPPQGLETVETQALAANAAFLLEASAADVVTVRICGREKCNLLQWQGRCNSERRDYGGSVLALAGFFVITTKWYFLHGDNNDSKISLLVVKNIIH